MADSSSRPPGWRQPVSPASPSRPVEQPWRNATNAIQSGPSWWRSRRARLAFVLFGLVLVTVGIVAVVQWLRPPRPMHLILIGPGYENNLAIPLNTAGRRGVEALAHLAEEHRNWRGKRAAVELGGDMTAVKQALKGSWMERAPKTVVLFISAHGIARSDGDNFVPCLVPSDDDLRKDSPLFRLPELLEVLAELPDTKKLLIVDATTVAAFWPLGQLHNDFAGALAAQLKRIEEIPNLVVLASSDKDQRSWVSPEWGQTYFAHFVVEGLKGAADDPEKEGDGNGRVDAWELYRYVRAQVERCVRHNRDRLQTPILLGTEERAKSLEVLAYQDYRPENELPPETDNPELKRVEEELQQAWSACRKLSQMSPHPAVYAPHLWRRYLDILLRSEQLVRAGDAAAAAKWLEGLNELQTRIRQAGPLPRESMQLTLAMPFALSSPLTPAERKALNKIEGLWQENAATKPYVDKDYDKARTALLDLAGNDRPRRQMLRAALAGLAVRKLAKDAEAGWSYGRPFLESVDAVAPYCRPAEIHYLRMLYPERGIGTPSPIDALEKAKRWPLVQKALQVVLLGEQAALGLGGEKAGENLPAYSEQVLPWIDETIGQADRQRRDAQDLLFASDPDKWQQAEQRLDEARAGYETAQRRAGDLRRALDIRDRVWAALPYYMRWAADAGSQPQLDLLADLWKRLHQLRRLLDQTAMGDARLAEIDKLAHGIAADFRKVEGWVQDSAARDNATSNHQDRWHEIEAVLAVPFLKPELRRGLRKASREISRELLARLDRAGDAKKDAGEENARQARQAAQRQGRLALAFLGSENWPEYATVNNAIEVPEEGAWQHSLTRAGESVGQILNRLPEETDLLCEQAAKADDLNRAAAQLRTALRYAHTLPGAAVGTRMKRDPAGEMRRLHWHRLLCRQAHRVFLDWWAELRQDEQTPPYFQRAADVFLRDAEELLMGARGRADAAKRRPRLKLVDAESRLVHDSPRLVVEWSPRRSSADFRPGSARVSLTDEDGIERFFRLRGPDAATVPGQPVAWVEAGPGLRPPGAEAHKRIVAFGSKFAAKIAADPAKQPSAGMARHSVEGFFRGHRSHAITEVSMPLGPDLVVSLPPLRGPGRVAVQTRRSLYELYGAEHTAVALVLDCSDSMNAKRPGEKLSRFQKAIRALEAVLEELPDGVTVSLRAFGARGFQEYQEVGGIQLIWERHRWRKADLPKRMKTVKELRPAYATPLIRSLAMAADRDLPRDKSARTIVAITDGGDGTFYSDPDLRNRSNISIEGFLKKKFAELDVQISVVGFEVDKGKLSKEELRGYQEFKPALAAIKGQYYDAENNDQLAEFLTRSLLHMYYRVDPDVAVDPGDFPDTGENISQSDKRENWRWVPLRQDTYRIRIPSVRSLQQRIDIRSGDALLLDLVPGLGLRPEFRRAVYAESDSITREHARIVSAKRPNGWLLAVLQNEQVPASRWLQLFATLEKIPDPERHPKRIQQAHPAWFWFEVPAVEPTSKTPPALRVTSLPDYPAPAWGLDVRDWPQGDPSALKAWWREERLAPHGQLQRKLDATASSLELGSRPWQVMPPQLGPVTLESVTLERCRVEDEPGQVRDVENCLVVRLSYPPDKGPFFVRLSDRYDREHGQEDRFYLESGKYTGICWPVAKEDLRKIDRLDLFSVAELKKTASHVDRLELGPPNPTWKRPQSARSKGKRP